MGLRALGEQGFSWLLSLIFMVTPRRDREELWSFYITAYICLHFLSLRWREKSTVFLFQLCPSKQTCNRVSTMCLSLSGMPNERMELWFKIGVALIQLKHNYLRAIYIFVINHAHYFENKVALSFTAACDLIYRATIWNDLFTLHCHCRLGRFCASAVSQQFNLFSPLGGDIFFYLFVWRCKTNRLAWLTSSTAAHSLILKPLCILNLTYNLYNLVVLTWQHNSVLSLICLFLLLVTASALSPTMISYISTTGKTARLTWLAVSKTVNFLRRSRALLTSCTWHFEVMALWATPAFIWNTKVLWRPIRVGFCIFFHKFVCVLARDLVVLEEKKKNIQGMLLWPPN